jgi:hypothetical protein
MPSRAGGTENVASSAAKRMSAASARLRPPPMQGPWMHASRGCGTASSAVEAAASTKLYAVAAAAPVRTVLNSLMSLPLLKALSLPRITSTRPPLACRTAVGTPRYISTEIAFCLPGWSRVM